MNTTKQKTKLGTAKHETGTKQPETWKHGWRDTGEDEQNNDTGDDTQMLNLIRREETGRKQNRIHWHRMRPFKVTEHRVDRTQGRHINKT